ncbi:MAG: GNVR domain-containing protein [Pseudomonadota bacterium]
MNKTFSTSSDNNTTPRRQNNKSIFSILLNANFWIVFTCIYVSLLIAIFLLSKVEPSYRVSTDLLIQAPGSNGASETTTNTDSAFYDTQKEILRSNSVTNKVISDLNLVRRYEAQPEIFRAYHSILSLITGHTDFTQSNNIGDALISEKTPLERQKVIAKLLLENLIVSNGGTSHVMQLSYENVDPDFATEIVSAFTSAFFEFSFNTQAANIRQAEQWFERESEALLLQVQNAESRLRIVEQQASGRQSNTTSQDNTSSQTIINEPSFDDVNNAVIAKILSESNQLQSIGNDSRLVGIIANDPSVQPELNEFVKQQEVVDAYFERYREKHPKMIEARATLSDIGNRLRLAVERTAISNMGNRQASSQSNITRPEPIGNTPSRNGASGSTLSNPLPNEFIDDTVASLRREVESAKQTYEEFRNKAQTVVQLANYTMPLVSVLDQPDSAVQIKPQTTFVLSIAAILGSIAGFLIVALRGVFFGRIKKATDIEKGTGITNLGILQTHPDKAEPQTPNFYYLKRIKSNFINSVDKIRDKILQVNVDHPPKVILLTSSTSSNSITELALNLSASFGKLGKTLLVETNLRDPHIGKVLKTPTRSGLSDVLIGSTTLDDAIIPVNGPQELSILNCGTTPQKPLQLLESSTFHVMMNSFINEYDTLLLAGPSCAHQADIECLLPFVDSVVMTEQAKVSTLRQFKKAVSKIADNGRDIMGTVLLEQRAKSSRRRSKKRRMPNLLNY